MVSNFIRHLNAVSNVSILKKKSHVCITENTGKEIVQHPITNALVGEVIDLDSDCDMDSLVTTVSPITTIIASRHGKAPMVPDLVDQVALSSASELSLHISNHESVGEPPQITKSVPKKRK